LCGVFTLQDGSFIYWKISTFFNFFIKEGNKIECPVPIIELVIKMRGLISVT
jgi:hypothetical protein